MTDPTPESAHMPESPLDERLHEALLDALGDESDAESALQAVLRTLHTRDQWQLLCDHGATAVGSREKAIASLDRRGPGGNCSDLRARTRAVIEFQPLDDWRDVISPPGQASDG